MRRSGRRIVFRRIERTSHRTVFVGRERAVVVVGGHRRREAKVRLKRACRVEYRVIIHAEGVEVVGKVRVGIGMYGKAMMFGVVERVIQESCISTFRIVWNNDAGSRVHLWREFGRTFSTLGISGQRSSSPPSPPGNVPWSRQCSFSGPGVARNRTLPHAFDPLQGQTVGNSDAIGLGCFFSS